MLRFDDVGVLNGTYRVTADMEVGAGGIVGVIGASGSGKSTLLEGLAGFLPLERGRILWRNEAIEDLDPGRRPVAMLFQDGNLFPHLTVAQNVGLGIRPDLRLKGDDKAAVEKALDRVGLAGLGPRRPGELSGGQRSRAALARVLVQGRPVLLLDEPFAALGPALKAEMLDLVKTLAAERGALVLMVTHDPGDVVRIADRVVLVDGGEARAPVQVRELLEAPSEELKAYLGDWAL
ncbi:thiamine ABC transporter ATP-binding protein [Chachezhania sediminis]|uniref:thiamine ABC transporter ATP-binding protein n=1 Tax=Chachezhania sediminis TaxID=2599291 RepID=UPI00131C8E90|nr:ATP-binding cassette domain-containing protein [Chachezhania sediminis]